MKRLSDQAIDRLRVAADPSDLSGTGYVWSTSSAQAAWAASFASWTRRSAGKSR